MAQRPELDFASGSESDRFEELLVNPAILTLTRQRGGIDCGGMEFVIVSYGNFNQLVIPIEQGHTSIAFEKTANPFQFVSKIKALLKARGA